MTRKHKMEENLIGDTGRGGTRDTALHAGLHPTLGQSRGTSRGDSCNFSISKG